MTAIEYYIAREPRDKSEHVHIDGEVNSVLAKFMLDVEVTASTKDELIDKLMNEMEQRDIDPEQCDGLQGFGFAYEAKHPGWRYDVRLGPRVAVLWHPDAIIPPCTVLNNEAVIYGAIERTT